MHGGTPTFSGKKSQKKSASLNTFAYSSYSCYLHPQILKGFAQIQPPSTPPSGCAIGHCHVFICTNVLYHFLPFTIYFPFSLCLNLPVSICLFVCLSLCLSVMFSVCLCINLAVCLAFFLYVTVSLSVCLSLCLSVCLFVCLFCLFVCLLSI